MGEQARRFVRQAEGRAVRNFPELPPDRRIDLRMVVAVQVRPDRGICVKIFASANVLQHRALAGRDHHRLAFQPVTHLGEWMPDKLLVEVCELVHPAGFEIWIFSCASAPASSEMSAAVMRCGNGHPQTRPAARHRRITNRGDENALFAQGGGGGDRPGFVADQDRNDGHGDFRFSISDV